MAPVIFRGVLKPLAIPLDFDKTWNGQPIFGKNKTFRGLIVGVASAVIIAYCQHLAYDAGLTRGISLIDYSTWLMVGILMGAGAILGDAVESYFKRRRGISPGHPWIPFDQIDFVIGAFILYSFVENPGVIVPLIGIFASFFLHIIINHAAFFLGIRKEKW